MTVAVCSNCGNYKHGAFARCPHCEHLPNARDDLVLSFALTDAFLGPAELQRYSQAIRQGQHIPVPEELALQVGPFLDGSLDRGIAQYLGSFGSGLPQEVAWHPPLSPTLRTLAEQAFALGHALVTIRRHLRRECGTLWSFFRNIFRTVDYNGFTVAADSLAADVQRLQGEVEEYIDNSSEALDAEFVRRLRLHLVALAKGTELTARKCRFMERRAKGATTGVAASDWSDIVRHEQQILWECDYSGKELTRCYHENLQ